VIRIKIATLMSIITTIWAFLHAREAPRGNSDNAAILGFGSIYCTTTVQPFLSI